jgi:hypothetical protein
MANEAFQDCLDFTPFYEGVYADVKSDPGAWTGGNARIGMPVCRTVL